MDVVTGGVDFVWNGEEGCGGFDDGVGLEGEGLAGFAVCHDFAFDGGVVGEVVNVGKGVFDGVFFG